MGNFRQHNGHINEEIGSIGSCLRFDSLLKISHSFFKNWDIEINDYTNWELFNKRYSYYKYEWETSDEEDHDRIKSAAEMAGLGDSNMNMNQYMADRLISILVNRRMVKKNKVIKLADIGCGVGNTALSVLDKLKTITNSHKLNTELLLIDPAKKSLERAKKRIQNYEIINCTFIQKSAEEALASPECSKFIEDADITTFGASLHHMTEDIILGNLYQISKETLLVGFADWCHGLLRSPAIFRDLITILDHWVEDGLLQNYNKLFPTSEYSKSDELMMVSSEPKTESDDRSLEIAANLSIIGFWVNYAVLAGKNPRFSPLEGHKPFRFWQTDFENNGFTLIEGPFYIIPNNMINTVAIYQKNDA